MTLAVVVSTGAFGGAEATDIHYFEHVVAAGVPVRVALPAEGELRARLEAIGARCDVVTSPRVLDELSRRYLTPPRSSRWRLADAAAAYELRLARWLRAVGARACVAAGFRAQLAVAGAAAMLRIPVAWIASDFIPTQPLPCRLWARLARLQPRVVVTYSRAAAEQPALRGAPVASVLSGVDLERFAPGPEHREPVLLMVGHLTPLKNHHGLLEVLRRVRVELPDARGLILGDSIYRTGDHDEYEREVRSAVARFEPPGTLALRPADAEEVARCMRKAALMLHLSAVPETFGRVCAEAMASGCVTIGYRRGATPEVLGDAGVLVEPDDLDAVAAAAVALLRDDDLRVRLALAARRRVEQLFDVERSGREGASVLLDALGLRPLR